MMAIENHTKVKKQHLTGFQVVEEECIWMKAGIINFRFCDNAYDCYHCAFDKGMQRTKRRGDQAASKIQEPGDGWSN